LVIFFYLFIICLYHCHGIKKLVYDFFFYFKKIKIKGIAKKKRQFIVIII